MPGGSSLCRGPAPAPASPHPWLCLDSPAPAPALLDNPHGPHPAEGLEAAPCAELDQCPPLQRPVCHSHPRPGPPTVFRGVG